MRLQDFHFQWPKTTVKSSGSQPSKKNAQVEYKSHQFLVLMMRIRMTMHIMNLESWWILQSNLSLHLSTWTKRRGMLSHIVCFLFFQSPHISFQISWNVKLPNTQESPPAGFLPAWIRSNHWARSPRGAKATALRSCNALLALIAYPTMGDPADFLIQKCEIYDIWVFP